LGDVGYLPVGCFKGIEPLGVDGEVSDQSFQVPGSLLCNAAAVPPCVDPEGQQDAGYNQDTF